jgi:hypothetical protein
MVTFDWPAKQAGATVCSGEALVLFRETPAEL